MNLTNHLRRSIIVAAVATTLVVSAAGTTRADNHPATTPVAGATTTGAAHPPTASGALVAAITAPTAPRSLTATPRNAKVKLAWLAPSSNGGATINKYRVQRARTGGPWTTIAYPTSRSYTATGLTNGTRYYFRVAAHNTAGWGPASTAVNAVPRTVPTAPRSPTVTPGNTTVKLAWLAPSSNGGATINKYRVQRSTAAAGPWATIAYPTTRSHTASGLTNGTKYYFRVAAHNAAGWGTPSTVLNAVPRTVPTAPLSPTATPGNSTINLSWLAPSSAGGAKIDQYSVQRAMSAGGPWEAIAAPTTRSYTAPGLNGITYYFRIAAHNASGWSTPSNVVNAAPFTVPGEPFFLTATPGNGTVELSWFAPPSGGSAIDHYIVEKATNAGGPWETIANPTALSYTATELNGGTTYYFRVAAHNAAGDGAPSWVISATTPVTKPSAPSACSVTQLNGPGSHTARINWSPPSNNGGTPITDYSVFLVHVEPDSVAYLNFVSGSTTETPPINNLPFGHYWAMVIAANQQGSGPECHSPVIVMQP